MIQPKRQVAALTATLVLALLAACSRPAGKSTTGAAPGATGPSAAIYFPGTDDRLHAETHLLSASLTTSEQRLKALAQAWIDGPDTDGLVRPLAGVESLHVDLSGDGTLYVDLLPAADATKPQLGSSEELTAIYSLVNTFALNVPDVKTVVLLWNGTQPPTLAGHIDTGVPLTADRSLVAGETTTP